MPDDSQPWLAQARAASTSTLRGHHANPHPCPRAVAADAHRKGIDAMRTHLTASYQPALNAFREVGLDGGRALGRRIRASPSRLLTWTAGGAHPSWLRHTLGVVALSSVPVVSALFVGYAYVSGGRDSGLEAVSLFLCSMATAVCAFAISKFVRPFEPHKDLRPRIEVALQVFAERGVPTLDLRFKQGTRFAYIHSVAEGVGVGLTLRQIVIVTDSGQCTQLSADEGAVAAAIAQAVRRVAGPAARATDTAPALGSVTWRVGAETPQPPKVEGGTVGLRDSTQLWERGDTPYRDSRRLALQVTAMLATVAGVQVTAYPADVSRVLCAALGIFPLVALAIPHLPGQTRQFKARQRASLTLTGSALGASGVAGTEKSRIELDTPFAIHLTRSTSRVNVSLVQHRQRIDFAVVTREAPELPALTTYAPVMPAHEFTEWLWPAIRFHAAANGHGVPLDAHLDR
jgi:hypothetical protein